MVVALSLGPRIVRDESRIHRVLMIVVVRECGMDLGRRQVGVLLDDVCRTVAMRYVIGDDVQHPMAGVVDARDSSAVESTVKVLT